MLRHGEKQAEQAAKTAARLELLLNEEPGSVWACDYSGDRESDKYTYNDVFSVSVQVCGGRRAGENVPVPAAGDGCGCASGQPTALL